MTHIRQRIREAIAAALATTGMPVFTSRVRLVQEDESGIALVYTLDEAVTLASNTSQQRTLQAVVDIRVRVNDGLDDELDTLALAAEQAMEAAGQMGGLIIGRAELTRTDIGLFGEGETAMGSARLTYSLRYQTPRGNPAA